MSPATNSLRSAAGSEITLAGISTPSEFAKRVTISSLEASSVGSIPTAFQYPFTLWSTCCDTSAIACNERLCCRGAERGVIKSGVPGSLSATNGTFDRIGTGTLFLGRSFSGGNVSSSCDWSNSFASPRGRGALATSWTGAVIDPGSTLLATFSSSPPRIHTTTTMLAATVAMTAAIAPSERFGLRRLGATRIPESPASRSLERLTSVPAVSGPN